MKETRQLLLKAIGKKPRTADEAIKRIYDKDREAGLERPRQWLFYTHLNKLLAPMERDGLIIQTGEKKGPTNRIEKVWRVK